LHFKKPIKHFFHMQLEIKNLSKTYPNGTKALDDVTLTIPKGMYGLLGQNGAGKSTLMRTLATLQDADSGSAMLGDIDILNSPDATRRTLGYLPQEFGVYPKTSATDMLNHLAVLKGFTNASERKQMVESLLQRVNLWDHRSKAVASYSGGMRQRFGIAQALIGSPQLIIVDEPTAGLDPGERNRFYNLLSEIGENVIVILSTHIVQDVMELCNNMAIIHKGKVLFDGTPNDAVASLEGKVWSKSVSKADLQEIATRQHVLSSKLVAGKPLVHLLSDTQPEEGFASVHPDLEDVFFARISA
jgi:ABC-2 type transport system ATP-binding protein